MYPTGVFLLFFQLSIKPHPPNGLKRPWDFLRFARPKAFQIWLPLKYRCVGLMTCAMERCGVSPDGMVKRWGWERLKGEDWWASRCLQIFCLFSWWFSTFYHGTLPLNHHLVGITSPSMGTYSTLLYQQLILVRYNPQKVCHLEVEPKLVFCPFHRMILSMKLVKKSHLLPLV